jgi:hypothetical protein
VQPNELDPDHPRITGKITDFGLSTILNPNPLWELDEGNSQVSTAWRWRAPEMADVEDKDIVGRDRFMEKADVWSFALTCLEVRMIIVALHAARSNFAECLVPSFQSTGITEPRVSLPNSPRKGIPESLAVACGNVNRALTPCEPRFGRQALGGSI